MINNFEKEIECMYKGETYSVRDNGAVLRHSPIGKKTRPTDNVWTFGKYNAKTGYAEIAGERVHRIVATAFHGPAPSLQHIVDHIDTNRRNNRPENLRWITKLENILLNPITAKRIELVCGSIEEFLKDPSKLRQSSIEKDFEWMRAVSKEEALASLERLQKWARSDKPLSGGSLGEWIYRRGSQIKISNIELAKDISQKSINIGVEIKGKTTPIKRESRIERVSKTNPFLFPRADKTAIDNTVVMYKTSVELFGLIERQLHSDIKLILPEIKLATSGRGIRIKESWIEEIKTFEYHSDSKTHAPKTIIIHCNENSIALLIRYNAKIDEKEINRLIGEGFNILELDLSWAKNGVTEEEMKYVLQEDITKKIWIYHELIQKAKEYVHNICEPIDGAGNGVLHSYIACPRTSNSVQDIDCWYCDYRIESNTVINGEPCNFGGCFGKSGVQTYQDLLSIIDVGKEDDKIVSISYYKNGETIIKKYDKEVQLPGKTIFQLWNEKTGNQLIAHNIYSNWYVLIEESPTESLKKTGEIQGKLARSIEELENCGVRSIFSCSDRCWVAVK